jgi:putative molybdopterin biosynthesis protein
VESDSYNLPYVQRVLPGKSVVGVTLAHRRLGFILAPGNPHKIQGLEDLTRPGIRFTNRQPGSGTRVWLDAILKQKQIQPDAIHGYRDERLTHSDVARVVAEGGADVGLGLETAARAYGLDFLFLNRERYDLVMLAETIENPPVRKLIDWLSSEQGRQFVDQHRGYDSQSSGQVWTIS